MSRLNYTIELVLLMAFLSGALGILIGFAAGRYTANADHANVPAVQVDTLDRLADAIIKYEGHPSGGLTCAGQTGAVCENGYVVGYSSGMISENSVDVARATARDLLRRDLDIKFRRWVRDDLMVKWCHPGPCAYRDDLLK